MRVEKLLSLKPPPHKEVYLSSSKFLRAESTGTKTPTVLKDLKVLHSGYNVKGIKLTTMRKKLKLKNVSTVPFGV